MTNRCPAAAIDIPSTWSGDEAVPRRLRRPARLRVAAPAPAGLGGDQRCEHRAGVHQCHARRPKAFDERSRATSRSCVFVALAPVAGRRLKARYQQVEIPPDWEQRGDAPLTNRHINVLVGRQRPAPGGRLQHRRLQDQLRPSSCRTDAPGLHYRNEHGRGEAAGRGLPRDLPGLRRGVEIDTGFAPLPDQPRRAVFPCGPSPAWPRASFLEALRLDSATWSRSAAWPGCTNASATRRRRASATDLARFHRDRNPYYRPRGPRRPSCSGTMRGRSRIWFAIDKAAPRFLLHARHGAPAARR